MLLDKLSELVEKSYSMSQGEELKATPGDELKPHEYGQVTEKFLSDFESHYEPPLFTPKEFITLMKELLVFADLSEGVYFMPCLLQVMSSEAVSRYRVSGEKALALHFPDSGPLMGMFCSTVAYLLSPENSHPCPWKVVENEAGTPECLNRNVIKFSVPDIAGTVSLVDHFTHFEIHVKTHPKKTAELWQLAHDAVFAGLKKAGKTIGYKENILFVLSYALTAPTTILSLPILAHLILPLLTRTECISVHRILNATETLMVPFHGCLYVAHQVSLVESVCGNCDFCSRIGTYMYMYFQLCNVFDVSSYFM